MREKRRGGDNSGDRDVLLRRVARSRRLPIGWVRLVSEGSLDDLAFVRAISQASSKPELWELVSPAAKEALVLPELTIGQLGGTRTDLLAMLLDTLELNTPANRNFFNRAGAALEYVKVQLRLMLEDQRAALMTQGKEAITSIKGARDSRTKSADTRAAKWLEREREFVRAGKTKSTAHLLIAQRENLKSAAVVKQAIHRFQKRQTVTD